MKLTFLGGADEVGASSTLVEIAGHRLLVDCGIRMQDRSGDQLPWLAHLQEIGGIEAIILTHAHMDHSGALPVVCSTYKVPLYLTSPTLALITILLLDAVKIMAMEQEREGEIPLYSLPMVENVMGAARTVPFLQPISLFGGEVKVTYYPAGHILGAGSVVIESKKDGTVMITGDIAATNQLTVPGLMIPPVKPDAIVIESTYGGRLHANRAAEEKRLIEQAQEVINRGGQMLIPAFAVGRAQEVILILSRAMEDKSLTRVPIFIDGMVRQVCGVYASFPELVTPWLRSRIKKLGRPFFYEDGPAMPIWDPRNRDECLKIKPCIFISSSGMLSGGPSQYYAIKMANDKKNFIAITGYQDEESPGRKVQDLAREGGGELTIGLDRIHLNCGVGTYSLSAHSDSSQILAELQALNPKNVILVHGNLEARQAIAQMAKDSGFKSVLLPDLTTTIEIKTRAKRATKADVAKDPSQPAVAQIQFENLAELAQKILDRDGPGRLYTVQEVLSCWGQAVEDITQEEISRVSDLLGYRKSPFSRDRKRQFIFRLRTTGKEILNVAKIAKQTPKIGIDSTTALSKVGSLFPLETGLYHKGAKAEEKIITLSFHFPKVASVLYEDLIKEAEEQTGWKVQVEPKTHQEALSEATLALVPEGVEVRKRPSIHLVEELVTIHVEGKTPDNAEELSQILFQKTGFKLVFKGTSPSLAPIQAPSSQLIQTVAKMEINASYAYIKEAFSSSTHKPFKTSLKGNTIELAFISPEVGQRYQNVINELEKKIGWPISIRQQPDQMQLQSIAKTLLSNKWKLLKEPSFLPQTRSISVKLVNKPSSEEINELIEQFKDLTGCLLVFS